MKARPVVFAAFAVMLQAPAFLAVAMQSLNPPYLSEMPSVERVKREVQGTDTQDTALRQIGAFWQLQEIIRALADRRDPDQLTPDEQRLKQLYYEAGYYVSQAIEVTLPTEEEKRRWRNRSPYRFSRSDPRFGVEGTDLFKRFFSPAFRAAFNQAVGGEQARHKAFEQSQLEAQKAAQAQVEADEKQQAAKGQEEREIARCIASGRPQIQCISEAMGKGFNELRGVVDPASRKAVPPGLRLNGAYAGQGGLSIGFHSSFASVSCRDARRDDLYAIEMKGNQLLITIQNEPMPYTLALTSGGALAGSGTIRVTGKAKIGTRRYTDGSSEPVYGMRTETCVLGTMPSAGPASAIEVSEVLGGLGPSARKSPPPLGLRMNGAYVGPGGLSLEFHADSAVVGCGEVALAQNYSVESQGNQVMVKIENPAKPIVLALKPDGKLAGSGTIQLNGRVVVGVTADSNNPVAYQPRSASCNIGLLEPAPESRSAAAAGAAAARESYNTGSTGNTGNAGNTPAPTRPNTAPAPKNPAGSGGIAILSLATGFAVQPGMANPLAGKSFLLGDDSFENILMQAGIRPQSGISSIKMWAFACQQGAPACRQGVAALAAHKVGEARTDQNGAASFSGIPAGTYYLFGTTAHNNEMVIWDLKVDLKPGSNTVILGRQNALPK